MTRLSKLTQSSALALCLPASAALADLSAAEVWADWETIMTGSGYTIEASESSIDNGLTVSDLTMTVDMSEGGDEGEISIDVGTLNFVETGDGSVRIEMPDTIGIDFSFESETDGNFTGTLQTVMTDQDLIASGAPDEITYDFAARAVDLSMINLMVDGQPIGEEFFKVRAAFEDMSYVTKSVVTDLRAITQMTTIGAINYTVSVSDPAGTETFDLTGNVRDLALDGGGNLPLEMNTQDANAMLDAGMKMGGQITTQGGGYDLTFKNPDGSGTVNATSEGAGFDFRFDPSGLAYGLAQRGVNISMLLSEIPVPISFSASELATNIMFPVQKSEDPQDFSTVVNMTGVVISDTLWGMFDPAGQLPRDPANLVVDLSGTAKVMINFLDPTQASVLAATEAMPGELQTLSLNALGLDLAGARLAGQGDFRFDNSDLSTFDGFPRPEGAFDLTLTGGNTLIDTLVNMGLLPQEQAMGARMMMGLFAVPGDGPDTLNSRIEVTPEGHVVANGQRLR